MIDLLYFGNPMCSWCWGFSPVLHRLLEAHQDRINLSVLMGSIGDRGRQPMNEHDRSYVRQHWEHVQELTGQPFDFGFFDRALFTYDTELPSRAVGVVRSVYPGLSLPFFAHLQERFYAHNEDITALSVLEKAAANFNVEPADFRRLYALPAISEGLRQEWQQTASLGVTGYPTLLAVQEGKPQVLSIGYRPYDQIEAAFREVAGLARVTA
ncbi:MAG: DsbA family protein [Pseudomonadota bacterium]